MTRRERKEAKLEKRREWAASREAKSAAEFQKSHDLVKDIPLGQPILVGHHSEKRHRRTIDRASSAANRGIESAEMAKKHVSVAGGIQRQLDTSIFSDDEDAITALEDRIASNEKRRESMKEINRAHKFFMKHGIEKTRAKFPDIGQGALDQIESYVPAYSWEPHPFPPYTLSNLGGRIASDRKRLVSVKRQQERQQAADSNGGVVIEKSTDHEYCSVTFAEKPDRAVIDALKAAGFHWGSGSWSGRYQQLPEGIEL